EHPRLVLQRAPTGSVGLCARRAGCAEPDLVHGFILPHLGLLRSCVGRPTRAAHIRPGSAHPSGSPIAQLRADRAATCQLPLLATRLGPAALRSALPSHYRCGTGLVPRSAAGVLIDLRHLPHRTQNPSTWPGHRFRTSPRSCRRPTPRAHGRHGCNGGGLAAHCSRWHSLAGRGSADAVLLPQYALMFAAGVLASRHRWLERVPTSVAAMSAALSAVTLSALAPGRMSPDPRVSAVAAGVLTAALGVGLSVVVLVIFRRLAPDTGPIRRFLSANAFTVYVIHPAILVGLALMLRDVTAPAIARFGVLLLLAVPACWLLAAVVRTIPGVKKIM